MAKIINSSIYGGEDSRGKPVKLADEEKHSIGRPLWIWVTRFIYPSLIIPSFLAGFFTGKSCSEPATPGAPQAIYKEGAPVRQEGTTILGPEQAARNSVIENHGEINVSVPAPNPASTPPPSPEAEVIKIERRITRGIIPSVQQ